MSSELTAAVVGFKKVLPKIEWDSRSGNQEWMEEESVEMPHPARQTTRLPSSMGKCASSRFMDKTTAGRVSGVSFRGTDLFVNRKRECIVRHL
jgi:hypothetical protein